MHPRNLQEKETLMPMPMPRSYTILFLFLLLLTTASGPANACHRCSRARAYLEYSCRPTRYPQLCAKTLMGYIKQQTPPHYHNPQELAQLALTASLNRAQLARSYMTLMVVKLDRVNGGREHQVITDCLNQVSHSIRQISESIQELRRINDNGSVDDFMWHMGNVMTWTSAALTDQNSCLDAFPRGRRSRVIQAAVKARVGDVARVTSNALALVNHFAMKRPLVHGRGSIKRPS